MTKLITIKIKGMYIQRNVKACWEFYIMHSPQTVIPFNPFCGGGGLTVLFLYSCVYTCYKALQLLELIMYIYKYT
jgi:hypothetical protein